VQLKSNFFLVKLLEDSGYDGPRHFDAHAYRTEDEEGVWDFAYGCMRNVLILKEKVQQFNEDAEIQGMLKELTPGSSGWDRVAAGYSSEAAAAISAQEFDVPRMAGRGYQYEKLDQLTVEIIMGVR
jgi:xylose isomerase